MGLKQCHKGGENTVQKKKTGGTGGGGTGGQQNWEKEKKKKKAPERKGVQIQRTTSLKRVRNTFKKGP